MIRFFCLLLACILGVGAQAQQKTQRPDSVEIVAPADTVMINSDKQVITIDTYATRFNPRKAMFYSAILPGAGQVYNQKYWKVPIVYGGFAFGIYQVKHYQDEYLFARDQLFEILNDPIGTGGTSSGGYKEQQLRNAVDQNQRYRNFWLILNGFWYIIQIMDAHVDAHLKEFELNPQLKVHVEPMLENNVMTGKTTGLALTIKF